MLDLSKISEAELRAAIQTPWRQRTERQTVIAKAWRKSERERAAQWYADQGVKPLVIK